MFATFAVRCEALPGHSIHLTPLSFPADTLRQPLSFPPHPLSGHHLRPRLRRAQGAVRLQRAPRAIPGPAHLPHTAGQGGGRGAHGTVPYVQRGVPGAQVRGRGWGGCGGRGLLPSGCLGFGACRDMARASRERWPMLGWDGAGPAACCPRLRSLIPGLSIGHGV